MTPSRVAPVLGAAVAGCVAWSYWQTFTELARRWTHDPQYSHAFLVPAFAAWLLWWRRG